MPQFDQPELYVSDGAHVDDPIRPVRAVSCEELPHVDEAIRPARVVWSMTKVMRDSIVTSIVVRIDGHMA